MRYKTIWWDAVDEDLETLEDLMSKFQGWEIFKMFLVYSGKKEAYRIVLHKNK